MPEHTPTPWHVYEKDPFVICEGGGGSIGIIEAGYPGVSEAEQIANAAYVVHCVPVHDDLVKALEVTGAELKVFAAMLHDDFTRGQINANIAKAETALARAKGGEG